MSPNRTRRPETEAQVFDVQLLDAFAEIESLMRTGREVQRDVLRLRNIAPTNGTQRRAAGRRVKNLIEQMNAECRTLCDIVQGLAEMADDLRAANGVSASRR